MIESDAEIEIQPADASLVDEIAGFLQPFIDSEELVPRTRDELGKLLDCAFIARAGDRIAGFAALEVYSRKLSEIQCLAVDPSFRRRGIGRSLVGACVAAATEIGVLEVMAISSSGEMFQACGFDYSLPNQKRAFFISPGNAREADPDSEKDGK